MFEVDGGCSSPMVVVQKTNQHVKGREFGLRTGATSRIRSAYLRDPDLDLIENSELVG